MKRKKRVLIIKTGFSEFLDKGISATVSLGDVLFCTIVLHLYKNDHVTWVVSNQAKDLLEGNPYIDRVLVFNPSIFKKIYKTKYDIFINLEKDIGICAFLGNIAAKKRYGFYFNEKKFDIETFKKQTRHLLSGQENQNNISENTAEILYKALGDKWDGQGLILNRKKNKPVYDIGFNYAVGSKWPTKAWPKENWKELEKTLKKDFSISWQEGHKNLNAYIRWINKCRVIVTSDSLGQMIGQALGKKVVTLFGPTNHKRMQRMPGIYIVNSSTRCSHKPCYMPFCQNSKFCMKDITPLSVNKKIRGILK